MEQEYEGTKLLGTDSQCLNWLQQWMELFFKLSVQESFKRMIFLNILVDVTLIQAPKYTRQMQEAETKIESMNNWKVPRLFWSVQEKLARQTLPRLCADYCSDGLPWIRLFFLNENSSLYNESLFLIIVHLQFCVISTSQWNFDVVETVSFFNDEKVWILLMNPNISVWIHIGAKICLHLLFRQIP